MPAETERRIAEWSAALFTRLECRDYARFDWRLDSAGEPRMLETIYRHQDIRIDHLQIDTLEIQIGQPAGDVAEIEVFDRERRCRIGDTSRRAGTPTERLGDKAPFDQVESASVVERNEAWPVPVEFFVHIVVENFLRNLSVSIGIDDHKASSVLL